MACFKSSGIFIVSLFLIFSSLKVAAQQGPVLYGGVDYFRDKEFTQDGYLNFSVGSQLFRWYFLAPEVGFEHGFGVTDEQSKLNTNDPNYRAPVKLQSRFSSNSFSVSPKLKFGNEEAALVFIPQFNTGKISARGDLLLDAGTRYVLGEQKRLSESFSYWSFAVGVEGQFFDSDVLYFALLLKYNFLNSEEILNRISFPDHDISSNGGSAEGLGIGFRVYFDFISLLR